MFYSIPSFTPELAGVKGIHLHSTRHTYATILLKHNTHPKIVQERLGHSTITTTLDTYSYVAPGLQAAATKNFDELLTPRQKIEPKKVVI